MYRYSEKNASNRYRCRVRQWKKKQLTRVLKVALQIFGRKLYKNIKKLSFYSQRLLIFIHKTPVIENDPTTVEIRELLQLRSTPKGIAIYFLHKQLAYLHTENTQKKVSNIASDENIRENNNLFVML